MKYPDVTAPRERSGLHGADTAVTKGTQSHKNPVPEGKNEEEA